MNIAKNYNEKELTISIDGAIDTVDAPDLENEINDEKGKFDSLILDFEKMDYISSAALGVLVATQDELYSQEIPFTIINTQERIKDIFEVAGIDKFLNIE